MFLLAYLITFILVEYTHKPYSKIQAPGALRLSVFAASGLAFLGFRV